MKRTITTPSRFTISTRNWRVRLAVLFFLLGIFSCYLIACRDDLSTLGFPEGSRFQVFYKELSIPSSVFGIDSMITFNSPDPNVTDARRFMIGRYSDNDFGEIQANIFTQIRPFTTDFTISNDATFESAVLTLCFDQYWYGPSAASTHSFEVHELTDSIITENAYFFDSRVSFSPNVLGRDVYTVNPEVFKKSQELNNDSDQLNNVVDSVAITLDPIYGEALFKIAQANGAEFKTFRKFRQIFKGLAIMPGAGDKIVGVNPDFANDIATRKSVSKTRLTVYYKTRDVAGNTVRRRVDFSLYKIANNNGLMGFTNIVANRSATELAAAFLPYREFLPNNGKRYVQAGNPILTKLDFSNFINFTDTITNMALNSAELVIDSVDAPSFAPPQQMHLRILKDGNKFRKTSDGIASPFIRTITNDPFGNLVLLTDDQRNFALRYQTENDINRYGGFLTQYLQRMYDVKIDSFRYRHYGLVTSVPDFNKSVERAIFDAKSIKLKLYYTKPTVLKTAN